MVRAMSFAVLVLLAGAGSAQSAESAAGQAHTASLSPQQVADYLSGKGMGLARVAELNGYPGPAHVLELAKELGLSPDQRARTEALFASMRADAVALGKELIDAEAALDRLFASRTVTSDALRAAVGRIGSLQAKLRRVHLDAHVEQAALLTPEQIARYHHLRAHHATDAGPDR